MNDRRALRKDHLTLWAAAIAALAGVVGAGLGGFFTYQASKSAESARSERRDAEEAALARGAARLLIDEYSDYQLFLVNTLNVGTTTPVSPETPVQLPFEDERRLATSLGPSDWQKVNNANRVIEESLILLRSYNVDYGSHPARAGIPLRRYVVGLLVATNQRVNRGRKALSELADFPFESGAQYRPKPFGLGA